MSYFILQDAFVLGIGILFGISFRYAALRNMHGLWLDAERRLNEVLSAKEIIRKRQEPDQSEREPMSVLGYRRIREERRIAI